ncbi:MAG: hypothetical protein ACFFBP_12890 [Promethearchaeota archaeon]
MRFCPECENLLIIKGYKLYCRTCDLYFKIPPEFQEDTILVKTINHSEKELEPVIIEHAFENDHISHEDREAYEDFFSLEED